MPAGTTENSDGVVVDDVVVKSGNPATACRAAGLWHNARGAGRLRDCLSMASKCRPITVAGLRLQAATATGVYSTVTLLARLRGLSTSVPRARAVW